MGTFVTIDVVDDGQATERTLAEREDAVARAFSWFRTLEATCTRFDPNSELMQLAAAAGRPVSVSPLLFEAVRFALEVASDTDGAFDPTVGRTMESRGFNREHRTGETVQSPIGAGDQPVTFRDVEIDERTHSITLHQPLILDLGAIVKGLAVDMAARELAALRNFAIYAGGDLYLSGTNARREPWAIGIRHPRDEAAIFEAVRVSDAAVCTSGDYERRSPADGGAHIVDPRDGRPASRAASVTVIAPTALVADALATAAFVLGPEDGLRLLARQGVEGLIVTPDLARHATGGFGRV